MSTYSILGIAGSLRAASTNKGLLRCAKAQAPREVEISIADLSQVPFYNADIKELPPAVAAIFTQMEKAHALLFACNEYNYSMAPALKNILDWASREPDNRLLEGKPAAIMGAAGGMGSSRAQYHLRQTCVFLNLIVMPKPEFFANAFTPIFDANGDLVDLNEITRVKNFMEAVLDWVDRHQQ